MPTPNSNLPVQLLEPTFALTDRQGGSRVPSIREQLRDLCISLDFFRDRRRALSFVFELFHVATLLTAIAFIMFFATPQRLLVTLALLYVFANVWNTVWYHRYCSHRAFTFSHALLPRLFVWLNPIGFREEIYALLHYPHHLHSDTPGDPYGPHLGRIGSYVASGRFRIVTDLSESEYVRLKGFLSHVPIRFASLASFKKWGSVEAPGHYLLRTAFANVFWTGVAAACAGVPGVAVWYTTVFVFTLLMRDFNFRGHGGGKVRHRAGWDFYRGHLAVNQWFYGLIASEWHNNHHMLPRSARTGFLPGQVDLAYGLIGLMRAVGLVDRLNDHAALFHRRVGQARPSAMAADATREATP